MTNYIYLHGFASSPKSAKAEYFLRRFQSLNISLKLLDLNQGDFSHLTITRQIEQVAAEFPTDETPVTLIGSSLGGLTAAHTSQKYSKVKQLVLLAPAFGFLSHWLPRLGEEQVQRWQEEKYLQVYHYGDKRSLPLHYKFVTDASQYLDEHLQRPIPTLILHGRYDEVIPITASRDYAASRPWVELIELEDDHSLGNVLSEMWKLIQAFCQL